MTDLINLINHNYYELKELIIYLLEFGFILRFYELLKECKDMSVLKNRIDREKRTRKEQEEYDEFRKKFKEFQKQEKEKIRY